MDLLKYLDITQAAFFTCLDTASNVEILSKIQELMEDLVHDFKDGIPRYEKKDIVEGCEHTAAKRELLNILLTEYNDRMFKPDMHRMHLCEAVLKRRKRRLISK